MLRYLLFPIHACSRSLSRYDKFASFHSLSHFINNILLFVLTHARPSEQRFRRVPSFREKNFSMFPSGCHGFHHCEKIIFQCFLVSLPQDETSRRSSEHSANIVPSRSLGMHPLPCLPCPLSPARLAPSPLPCSRIPGSSLFLREISLVLRFSVRRAAAPTVASPSITAACSAAIPSVICG